ncbi:hypothetical protein [Streptomyces xinghaiensis]|uniref:hypothetical protein n=1 Tax=Streptomyces xinghaiensis TaxID=1038928 RepID=UPI0002F7513C|nr:hypothetical protein [Streptomyces xinghaiensis]MZE75888.1 hypothetical protein [Streptomyces sp. SID5475]
MAFMQIIEYETTREQELEPLFDEWEQATQGKRTLSREFHAHDRDNPNHYVDVVEFPSYEAAMKNNSLPETQTFADRLRELCTTEPRFINLDVVSQH